MTTATFPPFRPHPLLRGAHAQTIAATFLHGAVITSTALPRHVLLADGDTIVLHDDQPPQWQPTDPVALLLPGLTGCHRSPYLVRTAAKLNARGLRTFRLDPRGWGASAELTRLPFHAGRIEDVAAALHFVARLAPQAPLTVAGYSLSGNILLRLLGTWTDRPLQLVRAAALCPAIDLAACADRLECVLPRTIYGRHFLRHLSAHLRRRGEWTGTKEWRAWTLREFDERITAGRAGYASAAEYYRECSAKRHLPDIEVPTLLIASRDDPVIPGVVFDDARPSPQISLHVSRQGGHLGFVGRSGVDPDRRWLDWRVVDWLSGV